MSFSLDPAVLGMAASLLANVVQLVLGRRRATAETEAVEAEGTLSEMQVADLLIKNLTEQYRAAVAEQAATRSEMEAMRHEIESLREEVTEMTGRFEEIARIVRSLPESIQQQFAEALTSPRRRRKPSPPKDE